MYSVQGKIHFASNRASLFSIAVLVCLLSAQSCHGCSEGCDRKRRDSGTAIGYGRGWITSRRSGSGDSGDDYEYKGVIGLSPDTVMHIGGRSGSALGKDIHFGEGFAIGSGDKGTGISVKEGAINGRGIGAAIEGGNDKDHRNAWNNFDPFKTDGKGFDGNVKTEYRGVRVAVASAGMAKCNVMSYFFVFIIFLLFI